MTHLLLFGLLGYSAETFKHFKFPFTLYSDILSRKWYSKCQLSELRCQPKTCRGCIFLSFLHASLSPWLIALGRCDASHLQLQMSQRRAYQHALKAASNPGTWKRSTLASKRKEMLQIYQKQTRLARHNRLTLGVLRSVRAHRVLLWPLKQMQLQSFHIERCLPAHIVR